MMDNNEKIYYRYIAEKYVDTTISGPFSEGDKTYFAVAPVGYLELPANDKFEKKMVEVPLEVRRVESDHYNVFTREKLVEQMIEFVEKILKLD